VFGPHHNPFQYRKTVAPFDVSEWTSAETFGDNATYPSLVVDADDTLHVAYRGGPSPNRLVYQRRPQGGAWSSPVWLVDADIPPGYTQYGNSLAVDADGAIHLGFHIYDQVTPAAGKAFGYLRSSDGGTSWTCADGTLQEPPVTRSSPCMIESSAALDMRVGNVALAPDGVAWLVGTHLEGAAPTVRLYHWQPGGWASVDLLPFVQQVQPHRYVTDATMTFDAFGTIYVAATTVEAGYSTPFGDASHEVVLLTSFDGGASFTFRPLSTANASLPSWLPSIERPFGGIPIGVPSVLYTHGANAEPPAEVVLAMLGKR
jgi:hypothetical protein